MGIGNPNQPAGSWCLHPYSGVMGPLEQFITAFLSTQKQIFRGTESTVAIVQDQWYYNKSSASLYSCWFNVLFFLNVSCAALLLLSHFILPHPAGGGYCLGLGGVTPCSPVPSSSPRNAVHFMNGSIWIFWTKKRATLWKPTSRDRCSALCGEVPQLMSSGDRGKMQWGTFPEPGSCLTPGLGSHVGTEQSCTELSFLHFLRSLLGPALRLPATEYTLTLVRTS